MAKQLQIRGGTTVQHSTFTGALREITIDTDKDVVVVHDGTTTGGFPLAKQTSVDSKVTKVTSTDNAVVRFNGTTGDVQNSGVIIDDNNNVGIGVTPSAWSSGEKAIELPHYGYFATKGPVCRVASNVYDNAGQKYTMTSYASMYEQSAGTHLWKTAPSGTAGNTIAFTQAMTLGSNGNLLVGTTTDNGVDKLQVNGSIALNNQIKIIPYNILGVGSITIPLPTNTISGYVTVGVSRWDTPSLSVVYFSKDIFYGHPTTVIENKINSAVSSAVLTSGSSSTLTLTFPYGTESWGNVLLTIIY